MKPSTVPRAIAQRLAPEGAAVVIAEIDQAAALAGSRAQHLVEELIETELETGKREESVEAYTRELWVVEGFTTYYTDLVLRRAGLVESEPRGRETHYSARPEGLKPLLGWMARYTEFWEARFDALEYLLKRMDQ